jgi:hypothetical protein
MRKTRKTVRTRGVTGRMAGRTTTLACRPQASSFALAAPTKPFLTPDTCNDDAVVHTDFTRLQGAWWSPNRGYTPVVASIGDIEAFVKLASGGDFCTSFIYTCLSL